MPRSAFVNSPVGTSSDLSKLERVAFLFLWILVFTMPSEKSLEIPGFGTVTKLTGLVAISFGVLAALGTNRVRAWTRAHLAICMFFLWSGATYFWSADSELTSSKFITYLQLFGMVLLIWQFGIAERQQLKLLNAYVLGMCVPAADTLIRYSLARQTYYQRYASEGFDPNDLALTCCLAIPMAYYLSLRSAGLVKWLYRFTIALAVMTILFTASRAATLATVAALSVVPWTFHYISRREKGLIACGAVLVTAALIAFVPATSWQRLGTAGREIQQGTMNSRTLIWKAGFDAFDDAPFRGVGAGAFPVIAERILGAPKETRMVAHNTFLSVLIETGVIGFGMFFVVLGLLASFIYQFPELDRRFWTVLLATWAIGVSSLTWEQRKPTWLLISLVVARFGCLPASGWSRAKLTMRKAPGDLSAGFENAAQA